MSAALKIPVLNKLRALQLYQVTRFGAPFLISVIIVRLMDKGDVGIYESLSLIGTSFTFFWVSGIINTFIPYYHSAEESSRNKLVFNVFALLCGLSLLCFLVLAGLRWVVFQPAQSTSIANTGMLYFSYLVYNLFNAPSFMLEYLLLVKDRPKAILICGIIFPMSQVAALTLPLWMGFSLNAAVLFLAASALLKFLVLTLMVARTGEGNLSLPILRPFLKKAIPAILVLILGGSMPYVDSYIILHYYDSAQFAIYRYGAQEMPLVLLMANALSNVYSGTIASANAGANITEGLTAMRKSSKRLMHTMFPLTILLLIFSHYLFTHFYTPAFEMSADIFSVFLLLTISRLVFPQTVLTGLMKNKEMLWFSAFEWVLNLVLDYAFLYKFGMIGIAYATVIAYFMQAFIQIVYLRIIGIPFRKYTPIRIWMAYSAVLLFVFWVMQAAEELM